MSRWAWRLQYLETLPLALRKLGSLKRSAALQVKMLDISARGGIDNWIVGAGLSYVIVTFDAIRVGLPLPSVTLGLQF